MNKKDKPSFLKGKGAAVGVVICFVAVIALVGTYTFANYRKDTDNQVAKADEQEEQLTEENTAEETTTDDIEVPDREDTKTETEQMTDEEQEEEPIVEDGQNEEDTAAEELSNDNTETAGNNTSGVWFGEDSILAWPASGAVILGYSMDQTVFFQTLEQYQYNPAMIISGEVGEPINASAAGIVTNIENTAQTGTTVTLDMGNGYSAVYGQLSEVAPAVGDYMAAGEKIGVLAEPTKYYSIEGPNLYFEILKDGEPVDPMNYME